MNPEQGNSAVRLKVLAPAAAVLVTILAGCPAELPLSRPGSAEDRQPAPSPSAPGSSDHQQPAPPPAPPPAPLPPKSAEQLAQESLEAPTPDEQEVAAVRLAELGRPAREHLQRVLSESQSPQVRAACIRALYAQWDYDSMPVFLDALDDESELVRARAGAAVERMMSVDFDYHHDDPPEKREAAVKRLREHWEQFRKSEIFANWKRRLQAREQREEQKRPEEHP